jgi:hypothetical protein
MSSSEIFGGFDYSALKRHYVNIDHVQLSFAGPLANVEQSYVVGTSAYLSDTTLPTTKPGWTIKTPIPPLPLIYQATGITQGPAFEAKDILFYATQACAISFDSPTRLPIPIPANTFMHFHTKHFVFYATQNGGTLDAWIEG